MRIFLVRHPETTANQQKIIYGKTDYPYTCLGKTQIESVLGYFYQEHIEANTKILTSSAGRALKLAHQLGVQFKKNIEIDHRLSEMNFGIFEGLTVKEAKTKHPLVYDDFVHRFATSSIPQGESYPHFQERVTNFMEMLEETTDYIIVTHGAVIREILEEVLALSPGGSWKFSVNNGTIIELEKKTYGFTVRQIIQPKLERAENKRK